jgi:hypothetical protein
MNLYEDDLRHFLRSEYEKAKENGFENIEIMNDFHTGLPIEPRNFYKLCLRLSKEEIHSPFTITSTFERGSTIIVQIQFIHNIERKK